jgi:hypothetical protein
MNNQMKTSHIDQRRYDELFKADISIHKEALKQAYEIRKFEIELYWKRATYFWTFIGAAFVGYAAFYNAASSSTAPNPNREFILILISCVGFVFSVAWHCVNKGSKYWQENWENHVELLEDQVFGPLYKTRTNRPQGQSSLGRRIKNFFFNKKTFPISGIHQIVEDFFVAPRPFSVSKINQLVSTFVALVWGLILITSVGDICFSGCEIVWKKAFPVCLTLFTCWGFWIFGGSNVGAHTPEVHLRTANVNPPP